MYHAHKKLGKKCLSVLIGPCFCIAQKFGLYFMQWEVIKKLKEKVYGGFF